MKFRHALLGATLLALPVVANAQPVAGLYVGAGAGVNWLMPQNITAQAGGLSESLGDTSTRLGFAGVGSIGWGFGNGLRAEVEGNWRNNGITGIGGCGPVCGGRINTYGVMVNALFDMDIGTPWLYPYVGAGVGYGWQALRAHVGPGTIDGTDSNFAFQAIAGAAFPIAGVPGLSLTAEYRFFGMLDTLYNAKGFNSELPVTVKVGNSYNHSILLGVRYAFNAAPAPVPAAPVAVAPAAKSYLIFFDWDKSALTDRARAILKEAAAGSKSVRHTVVEVNGYADTSGNPQYNVGLSMRRAQTTAAELVRDGVPKQEIAIKAFGDTVLLVPTGPGVREPQNRRTEIIVR